MCAKPGISASSFLSRRRTSEVVGGELQAAAPCPRTSILASGTHLRAVDCLGATLGLLVGFRFRGPCSLFHLGIRNRGGLELASTTGVEPRSTQRAC
jgi:hypothetical protein